MRPIWQHPNYFYWFRILPSKHETECFFFFVYALNEFNVTAVKSKSFVIVSAGKRHEKSDARVRLGLIANVLGREPSNYLQIELLKNLSAVPDKKTIGNKLQSAGISLKS